MEPETNTLTPDVIEKKRSNAPLYIIFGFLLAAIITLVIVIVVVNVNNSQVAKVEPAEPSDENIIITNPEGYKQGQEFQARLNDTINEAHKLLDENLQNADKVKELFASVIFDYSDPNEVGYARTLVDAEIELLLSYNLTEKAFEIYNQVDSYIANDLSFQNGLFSNALALAKKENNQSWMNIFQAKFDATKAAKQAALDATSQNQTSYDERLQKRIDEDNRKAAERKTNNTSHTEEE